jgi:hypothetical protein
MPTPAAQRLGTCVLPRIFTSTIAAATAIGQRATPPLRAVIESDDHLAPPRLVGCVAVGFHAIAEPSFSSSSSRRGSWKTRTASKAPKAGNAPPLTDAKTGLTFPDLNGHGEFLKTNLIMPKPPVFLDRKFPICSIIRSTEAEGAAVGAAKAVTASGLFKGQSQELSAAVTALAQASNARAPRGAGRNQESERAGPHSGRPAVLTK